YWSLDVCSSYLEIKTYRAASLQEALAMVREDLGPSAAVLHTREIRGHRLLRWIPGVRQVEVAASLDVNVPSRLRRREQAAAPAAPAPEVQQRQAVSRPQSTPSRDLGSELKSQLDGLQAMLADLCRQSQVAGRPDVPQELFHLFTDLIDAELPEDIARELVQRVREEHAIEELADPAAAKAQAARLIEA